MLSSICNKKIDELFAEREGKILINYQKKILLDLLKFRYQTSSPAMLDHLRSFKKFLRTKPKLNFFFLLCIHINSLKSNI